MPHTFEVRRTNFHADADEKSSRSPYDPSLTVLSRHRSEHAAEKAARRMRSSTCTCGCAVVVDLAEERAIAARDAAYRADMRAEASP